MTILTPTSKQHILDGLALINEKLQAARDKFQEVETEGVNGGIPDLDDANEVIRSAIAESIEIKFDLMANWFPDYEINNTDKINFYEFYDFFRLINTLYKNLVQIILRIWSGKHKDSDVVDLSIIANELEFIMNLMDRYLGLDWADQDAKIKLQTLVNQIQNLMDTMRAYSRIRNRVVWVFGGWLLVFWFLFLLRRCMNAVQDFLMCLNKDDFEYRESLSFLSVIDNYIEEVIMSTPVDILPHILPGVNKIDAARETKHRLEDLIKNSRTE